MKQLRRNKKELQRIINAWKKLRRIAPVNEKDAFIPAMAVLYVLRDSQSKALRQRFQRQVVTYSAGFEVIEK